MTTGIILEGDLTMSRACMKSVLMTMLLLLVMQTGQVDAQQIVTDGNTATSLNTSGAVTEVTTTTTAGSNAFNSFSKFDVDAGNTVNLVVPDASDHLINLIHDEAGSFNTKQHSIINLIIRS